jgi:hypothetical protein
MTSPRTTAETRLAFSRAYAGTRVKDRGRIIHAFREARRHVGIAWRWYPSVFISFIGALAALSRFGLLAFAIVAIIGGWVVYARISDEGNRLQAIWGFRMESRWRSMCLKMSLTCAGWMRSGQGCKFFPELEQITYADEALSLKIHTMPIGMDDKAWPLEAMEEGLRGTLGFVNGEVIEHPEEADRYTFRLTSKPMPTMVPVERYMFDLGERVVPVGIALTGEIVAFDLATIPHILVAGQTDMGKSSWLRNCLLTKALLDDWAITIIDGKGIDYGWMSVLGADVHAAEPSALGYEDPAKLHGRISGIMHTMNQRRWLMDKMEVGENWSRFREKVAWLEQRRDQDGWDLDQWLIGNGFSFVTTKGSGDNKIETEHQLVWADIEEASRFMLVLCDELGSVLQAVGKNNTGPAAQVAFATVAQKCRAFGMHLVIAAQRPDVQDLGVRGGSARAQFGNRLAFGNLDQAGRVMVWEDAKDPDIAKAIKSGVKGRGAAGGLMGHPGDIRLIQAPFMDEVSMVKWVLEQRPELATPEALGWVVDRIKYQGVEA